MISKQNAAVGALLAFGVGDALGWPMELRGGRVVGDQVLNPELAFHGWTRREGGQNSPTQTFIPPGAYSDDTQLTLAVARSLHHRDWWEHLTEVELPWWPHYQLGGGGATRRAAQSWARGVPPWRDKSADRYWDAGGNGAAMRILPHCFDGASFSEVRRRVLADGATTHGHPIALVGAQAFAFGLWAINHTSSALGWGELLSRALDQRSEWSRFEADCVPAGWAGALPTDYEDRWERTVEEMCQRLHYASGELAHGALNRDRQVLDSLGGFSKENGAGTVTTACAFYLGSRHASDPRQGVLRAAFAKGADTDTLAAMSGALLGALHGPDWLGRISREVMDGPLMERVASEFGQNGDGPSEPFRRAAKKQANDLIAGTCPGDRVRLPFYGEVKVLDVLDGDNRNSRIRNWWMHNEDGQTFRIQRRSQAKKSPWPPMGGRAASSGSTTEGVRFRSGLVLRVADIDESRHFYERIVGMPFTRATKTAVVLGNWLALEQTHSPRVPGSLDHGALAVTLYAEESVLHEVRDQMRAHGIECSVERDKAGQVLRTQDPDGVPVELRWQRSSEGGKAST